MELIIIDIIAIHRHKRLKEKASFARLLSSTFD
jgi:hypothetical protein